MESGTAGPDIRFGLGFQLASPSMPGLGPASFGHTGAGARLGLADPDLGVGFGYVCSRMRVIGPHGDAAVEPSARRGATLRGVRERTTERPSSGVVVGLSGLEPLTSALSGQRSNRLSYRPAENRGALRGDPRCDLQG